MIETTSMPRIARLLGFAGLLPQLVALALVASGNDRYTFAALAMAFAYAALILSFLGGLWWGLAARAATPPDWLWVAAVTPSLVALATFLPWAFAGQWPVPSIMALGMAIIGSLAVDLVLVRKGLTPSWWMALRLPLSLGLGVITLAVGIIS